MQIVKLHISKTTHIKFLLAVSLLNNVKKEYATCKVVNNDFHREEKKFRSARSFLYF